MTNLNPWVSAKKYGLEAHFMRVGGVVEVMAQQWKLNDRNLAEVLSRYPRDDFAQDSINHVRREAAQNHGSRFGWLNRLYCMAIPKMVFKV